MNPVRLIVKEDDLIIFNEITVNDNIDQNRICKVLMTLPEPPVEEEENSDTKKSEHKSDDSADENGEPD